MIKASLIFIILLVSSLSQASMYFEPTVGYGKGSAKVSTSSELSADTYVSPSVGFKFGYFVDYVYLVADVRYSIINVMELPTSSSQTHTNIGVGVAWDWNLPIRTYLALDLNTNANIEGSNLRGSGTRFGLGYYLSLNTLLSVEFVSTKFTGETEVVDVEATYSTTMITFSFPIEFIYPQTSWKDKVR